MSKHFVCKMQVWHKYDALNSADQVEIHFSLGMDVKALEVWFLKCWPRLWGAIGVIPPTWSWWKFSMQWDNPVIWELLASSPRWYVKRYDSFPTSDLSFSEFLLCLPSTWISQVELLAINEKQAPKETITWFQSNAFILLRVWGFKDCSWQKKWKWSMSIMKSDEISLFFECRQKSSGHKQHPGFYRPDPVLRLLCRWRKLTHTSRISSPFHLYTWIYCFIPIIPSHPYGTCPYLSDFACHWLMVWRVNGFCKRICFCTSGFYEDLEIQSMPLVRHLMSFDILFKLP